MAFRDHLPSSASQYCHILTPPLPPALPPSTSWYLPVINTQQNTFWGCSPGSNSSSQHRYLTGEWMSERETGHLIAYWVSWGLLIAGRLWPSAWLNQHLCGVSGHIREPSAQCELEEGIPTEKTFPAFCTQILFLFIIDRRLTFSLLLLLLKVYVSSFYLNWMKEVMSLAFEGNPKFRVTYTYVYRTYQFKDMLYVENQWACKWCTLYARLMDKSPFLKCFMIFPCRFFFFFLSFLLNLEGKPTAARSGNKQTNKKMQYSVDWYSKRAFLITAFPKA